METHRVLVTSVGGNVGQGVIKSLRAGKRKYFIIGLDMESLAAGFSLADSYCRVSKTGSPDFTEDLCSIARKERVEAIYVCSPSELEFFTTHKAELERDAEISVFVNPPEVIDVGSDKLKTANFLRDFGFPYPDTVAASDDVGIDRIIAASGFPVFLKPRIGSSSRNVFLVNSIEEIRAARTLVADLIVQRYLPDATREYTAATVSGEDRIVRACIILHRDLIQGTTYRTELVQNKHMTERVVRIVETLGAVGVCNLQFRLLDGEVFVFEINPRLSGSCGIRYLYGFNESEMLFELFRLGLDVCQPELSSAVVLRYWNEIHLPGATFDGLSRGIQKHNGTQTVFSSRPVTS
jgi:carbamoyl-phosphate synthase large subunit